jgi:UDP-N-acetylglucosamine 2-epimerase (non-hydrolysing)
VRWLEYVPSLHRLGIAPIHCLDSGSIILGGITTNEILSAIDTCQNTFNHNEFTLPAEYLINDVSTRVIRIVQSYTNIINKVIWNK